MLLSFCLFVPWLPLCSHRATPRLPCLLPSCDPRKKRGKGKEGFVCGWGSGNLESRGLIHTAWLLMDLGRHLAQPATPALAAPSSPGGLCVSAGAGGPQPWRPLRGRTLRVWSGWCTRAAPSYWGGCGRVAQTSPRAESVGPSGGGGVWSTGRGQAGSRAGP